MRGIRSCLRGVVLSGALVVAACGGDPPGTTGSPLARIPGPVALADLRGQWQPTPFVVDQALRERFAAACRRSMPDLTGRLVTLDVRGGGLANGIATDPVGGCDVLKIDATGQIEHSGGGWSIAEPESPWPAGVAIDGGASILNDDPRVEGWEVIGRAGPSIALVVIEAPGQPAIQATLENGRFSAWWPVVGANGGPSPSYVVRGFDESGTLIDQQEFSPSF